MGVCAWGVFPEINALIHLEPFPDDDFRWKVSISEDFHEKLNSLFIQYLRKFVFASFFRTGHGIGHFKYCWYIHCGSSCDNDFRTSYFQNYDTADPVCIKLKFSNNTNL